MKASELILNELNKFQENQMIFASSLYKEKFDELLTEAAYYKSIERLCLEKKLIKIAKGTYHLPKRSKYGIVPPSSQDIIAPFINKDNGVEVGYSLYNKYNLSTQISKKIILFSSYLSGDTKQIENVLIHKLDVDYNDNMKCMIQMLDVLQNFYSIQDLNYNSFILYFKENVEKYDDDIFDILQTKIKYKKSTISFFKSILDYFNINNNLSKYLSNLSKYKHPKMEEIYEITRK